MGFPETMEWSLENLKSFVKGIADGTLKHSHKSEPEPTSQDAVFVAVGTTLENTINQDKDVLVEFYAPWCGHCKSLEPIYTKLAEGLKGVDNIVIAKIDASNNDVKHIVGKNTIAGFPTIIFYPANNKQEPIKYESDRTVPGFVRFLKEHASKPFQVPAGLEASGDAEVDEHAGHDHGAHDEL